MSSDDSDSDPEPMAEEEEAGGASSSVVNETHWPNDDPDTLRILLSTDNHLGYAERDVVRGMDSFAAFEEVLYLAKKFRCDMVLIAGDLFHDNRPSRRTLHKTMEILRRYCMGPEPVKIEFLSDAAAQLRSAVTVNYQDANYAVGLPLFSIHGNHDDPSRDQGGGDLLAALDLLAVSNLVNYFGRQDQVDKVEISPLLLQKGITKIALYGLGSLRDERLNRMWEKKKVRFLRPENDNNNENEGEEEEEFFNIFTLHQNRDLGRGAKNCVQESMIPEWMDIVVWGHEHECLIEFFESVVGTFRITQPGSSVATSLVSGEAARKKIGILDIRGKNFRLHPVPLTQVRSFVTTELSLREHRADLDANHSKVENLVSSVLEEEVQLMVLSAREKMEALLKDAREAGNDAWKESSPIKYKLQSPNEVLVRIRVEHSGFSTLNNQRFGAKFVGDVANPNDMLLFHRKKDPKMASKIKSKKLEPIAPEELEQTNLDDLIRQQLEVGGGNMQVFGQQELADAMGDFVDKSLTAAIADVAKDILKKKTKILVNQGKANDDEVMIEKESQIQEILQRESQSQKDASMMEEEDDELSQQSKKSSKKRKAAASSKGKENSFELDDDDEDFGAPKARSKKAAAKNTSDDLDDDDDDDFEEPKPRAKMAPPPKSKTKAARRKKASSDSEDISDDDDDIEVVEKPASKPRSKPAARPKRSTVKRTAKYAFDSDEEEDEDAIVDSDDEDDDVLEVEEPKSKRKKAPTKSSSSSRAKSKTASSKKTTTSGTARSKKKSTGMNTSRRTQFTDSDDEEVEFVGSAALNEDWGSAATRSQF